MWSIILIYIFEGADPSASLSSPVFLSPSVLSSVSDIMLLTPLGKWGGGGGGNQKHRTIPFYPGSQQDAKVRRLSPL